MFSLTIAVPQHIEIEKHPRPIVVKFKTKEEKEAYLIGEYKYTEQALKDLAKAWSKYQRAHAYEKLYTMRKSWYDLQKHKENPKDVA